MAPYSFDLSHVDSCNTKVPKTITLDYMNMRKFLELGDGLARTGVPIQQPATAA
jgi:hypothetical protein